MRPGAPLFLLRLAPRHLFLILALTRVCRLRLWVPVSAKWALVPFAVRSCPVAALHNFIVVSSVHVFWFGSIPLLRTVLPPGEKLWA
jgi:hypothetical protein